MKKVVLLLVLLLALPIVFSATPYSEVWFTSGNTFSLDGKTYSLLFQGTGNTTRILVRDEGNVSMSEVISLGDCFETDYKEVCFVETNLLEGYSKRVLAEFYKTDYGFNVIVSIPDDSIFVFEESEVTLTFEKNNTVKNLDFLAYFDDEIILSNFDGCFHVQNETGQFVRMQVANPRNEEECQFTMTSPYPVEFDFVGEYYYDFIDRQERESLSPVGVEFKRPFGLTYKYPTINSSENFDLNITFTNPTQERLKFENLVFHIPEELRTTKKKEVSSYGAQYYTFTESFTLNEGESKNLLYNFDLNYEGNYTILFLPEINFGQETYRGNRLEKIIVLFNPDDAEDSNISKYCDGDDLFVNLTDPSKVSLVSSNETFDIERTFLPGTEIDFKVYISSETREVIDDLTFSLYENDKLIGKRTYSSLGGLGRILFSRVYSIIPVSGATNRNYKIVGEYMCGKKYNFEYEFDIELADFADIDVERDAPGSLITGEEDEVIVTVTNNEDWFVENILLEEIIPPEFEAEGITRRILSLEPDSEEEAYRYFIKPISDVEKSYTITTKMVLNHNGELQEQEFDKTISINNVDLADLEVKVLQDTFYLNEPAFITFEIENEGDFPARNLIVDFDKNNSFDILKNVPFKVPTIFPGQLLKIEIPIIPREKIDVTYYLNYSNEQEDDELELDVLNQRLDLPLVNYTIDYLTLIDGTTNATVHVTNPSDKNTTILVAGTEVIVRAESSESVVVNIPEQRGYLIEYELFGYIYKTYPTSVSTSKQTVISTPESQYDGTTTEDDYLSETTSEGATEFSNETEVNEDIIEVDVAEQEFNLKKIIAISLLIITAIAGLGFLVSRRIKSNSKNLKLKSIQPPSGVNPSKESLNENQVKEKEVASSNIFSYNEYEKLKKNLEK